MLAHTWSIPLIAPPVNAPKGMKMGGNRSKMVGKNSPAQPANHQEVWYNQPQPN